MDELAKLAHDLHLPLKDDQSRPWNPWVSIMTSFPSQPLIFSSRRSRTPLDGPSDVVELPLLLPKDWAEELIDLADMRRQSVANLLRDLVGQAIDRKHAPESINRQPNY